MTNGTRIAERNQFVRARTAGEAVDRRVLVIGLT
jgi:hypothetical protein